MTNTVVIITYSFILRICHYQYKHFFYSLFGLEFGKIFRYVRDGSINIC